MSQRVVGYVGEGRARTPVYAIDPPAVARMSGYLEYASQGGMAFIMGGGTLVQGRHGSTEATRQYHRDYMARRRARS